MRDAPEAFLFRVWNECFFNYRDYIVNKSQTIDCLLTIDVFKSPVRDSNEYFSWY